MVYPGHRYMLAYTDCIDATRCHSFNAPSDAVALAYAKEYCKEVRREFVSGFSKAGHSFHVTVHAHWYCLDVLEDLDDRRRIFTREG